MLSGFGDKHCHQIELLPFWVKEKQIPCFFDVLALYCIKIVFLRPICVPEELSECRRKDQTRNHPLLDWGGVEPHNDPIAVTIAGLSLVHEKHQTDIH